MVTYSRRAAIASGIALLAGCSGRTGSPRSDTDPSPNATRANTTASQSATNGTDSDELEEPILEPDERLSYGESLQDAALEVTVGQLSIETSLRIESLYTPVGPYTDENTTGEKSGNSTESQSDDTEVVDLPDGEAIALAPVTFTNRHETDIIYLLVPNFDLVGPGLRQDETQSIPHPQSDEGIEPQDLARFDDPFLRWSMHGSKIEVGESVDALAMFEVPEGTTTESVAVAYDSTQFGVPSDHYGTTTAHWMDSQ